jgi:hypothetical protein
VESSYRQVLISSGFLLRIVLHNADVHMDTGNEIYCGYFSTSEKRYEDDVSGVR